VLAVAAAAFVATCYLSSIASVLLVDPSPPGEACEVPPFAGFATPAQEQGFHQTLDILGGLLAAGRFPLRPDDHCAWCDFRLACRRSHPPTLEREADAADSADYRRVQDKTQRAPLLVNATGQADP
jgi:hypothetical protein